MASISSRALRMYPRALDAVLSGAEWLTLAQVHGRIRPHTDNAVAVVRSWLRERLVFAIEIHGQQRFPAYAFDELGQPLPGMAEVLQILHGRAGLTVASWFESPSSFLGGRRPRELIGSHPSLVVAAARDHLIGPVHG